MHLNYWQIIGALFGFGTGGALSYLWGFYDGRKKQKAIDREKLELLIDHFDKKENLGNSGTSSET